MNRSPRLPSTRPPAGSTPTVSRPPVGVLPRLDPAQAGHFRKFPEPDLVLVPLQPRLPLLGPPVFHRLGKVLGDAGELALTGRHETPSTGQSMPAVGEPTLRGAP